MAEDTTAPPATTLNKSASRLRFGSITNEHVHLWVIWHDHSSFFLTAFRKISQGVWQLTVDPECCPYPFKPRMPACGRMTSQHAKTLPPIWDTLVYRRTPGRQRRVQRVLSTRSAQEDKRYLHKSRSQLIGHRPLRGLPGRSLPRISSDTEGADHRQDSERQNKWNVARGAG